MKYAAMVVLGISVGVVSGCGEAEKKKGGAESAKPEPKPPATSAAPAASAAPAPAPAAGGGGVTGPATADGAKAVLGDLQKATDPKAAMAKLAPGVDDLKAIFTDAAVAGDVKTHVDKLMAGQGALEKGDAEVTCASSDDVKAWKPEVEKHFPGGYKRVGPKLAAGLTLCKFKIGSVSYDSLVNAGGKWFFVPKPFRAIKE